MKWTSFLNVRLHIVFFSYRNAARKAVIGTKDKIFIVCDKLMYNL